MASRRTGWSRLSEPYRHRIERSGITRKEWERGADLRGARGHAPAPPPHSAPPEITREAVRGEATYQAIRDDLGSWRRESAPAWLPSPSWMGHDSAAALSQLRAGPSHWRDVSFTPSSGGPWTMTVTYDRGYPQTIEVPGGSGAQEILKMLSNPDSVGIEDTDEWEDWIDNDRDYDVEGTS